MRPERVRGALAPSNEDCRRDGQQPRPDVKGSIQHPRSAHRSRDAGENEIPACDALAVAQDERGSNGPPLGAVGGQAVRLRSRFPCLGEVSRCLLRIRFRRRGSEGTSTSIDAEPSWMPACAVLSGSFVTFALAPYSIGPGVWAAERSGGGRNLSNACPRSERSQRAKLARHGAEARCRGWGRLHPNGRVSANGIRDPGARLGAIGQLAARA